ncbi:MAG: HipA N-terminal domain-containing protein [Bacteroidales bacterium]|nr:HipA N-terminal domain-containing protein [Bacteroidales bacterium]
MINFADVYIWGQQVGTVAWDANRQAGSFEYSSAFTGTGLELSPLMMPVISNNIYEFSSLPTETFIGFLVYLPMLCPTLSERHYSTVG